MMSSWTGDHYTSDEQYERERRCLFGNAWVCAALVEELPHRGSFLRVDVGGESVLLVRDGQEVRGLLNLCRHRGARLCRDERGRLDSSIPCMYHGWTYGLDGRLLGAPHMRQLPDGTREERSLHRVATAQWLGQVWVNLAAAPEPLSAQMEPQLAARFERDDPLERHGIHALRTAATRVYDVRANWKLIVENFSECYHCPTLHPELTAALPSFRSGYGTVSGRRDAPLADGMDGFSLSGRAAAPPLPGLADPDERTFSAVNLWPNLVVVLLTDHVVTLRLQPLDAARTRVTAHWLFHPDALADPAFDAEDAVGLLDLANRQDFEAGERVQLGTESAYFESFYPVYEHVIDDFHRWVEEALGEGEEVAAGRRA